MTSCANCAQGTTRRHLAQRRHRAPHESQGRILQVGAKMGNDGPSTTLFTRRLCRSSVRLTSRIGEEVGLKARRLGVAFTKAAVAQSRRFDPPRSEPLIGAAASLAAVFPLTRGHCRCEGGRRHPRRQAMGGPTTLALRLPTSTVLGHLEAEVWSQALACPQAARAARGAADTRAATEPTVALTLRRCSSGARCAGRGAARSGASVVQGQRSPPWSIARPCSPAGPGHGLRTTAHGVAGSLWRGARRLTQREFASTPSAAQPRRRLHTTAPQPRQPRTGASRLEEAHGVAGMRACSARRPPTMSRQLRMAASRLRTRRVPRSSTAARRP